MKNLSKLDLSQNLLQIIQKAIFVDLESLKILKLNGNKLTFLAPSTFNGLKKLEYLDLTENWFTTIDPIVFGPIMISPVMIDVTTNPFICNCGIQSFLNWAREKGERLMLVKQFF